MRISPVKPINPTLKAKNKKMSDEYNEHVFTPTQTPKSESRDCISRENQKSNKKQLFLGKKLKRPLKDSDTENSFDEIQKKKSKCDENETKINKRISDSLFSESDSESDEVKRKKTLEKPHSQCESTRNHLPRSSKTMQSMCEKDLFSNSSKSSTTEKDRTEKKSKSHKDFKKNKSDKKQIDSSNTVDKYFPIIVAQTKVPKKDKSSKKNLKQEAIIERPIKLMTPAEEKHANEEHDKLIKTLAELRDNLKPETLPDIEILNLKEMSPIKIASTLNEHQKILDKHFKDHCKGSVRL